MPTVLSKPQRASRKTSRALSNHAIISRLNYYSRQRRKKLAQQISIKRRSKSPTRFEAVEMAVRKNFFSTRVSIKLDSTSYEFIETLYSSITGKKHIDVYKNAILLKSDLIAPTERDILRGQVKALLDRYVNRPRTVIKTLNCVYQSCNQYLPCFPLLELLKPGNLRIGTVTFASNFGNVDLSLVDFINTCNPREIYLMINNPRLTGRLLNLSKQNYHIYEERILEILFLAHCQKFISEDFPVGSSYHASEKFRHFVPNSFIPNIMSTFPNSERVRYSKHCKTAFVASDIPLRVTVAFGNDKVLEVYNDDYNYVAVVAAADPPRGNWFEILDETLRANHRVVSYIVYAFLILLWVVLV